MAKLSGGASDRLLLAINYALLIGGSFSSTMLTRFYFIHGGSSRWLTTVVQSSAFPLLLIPIIIFSTSTPIFSNFTPKLLLLCLAIGLLNGVNNFLISWGISYLPVSTSSLILSSQLAFTLVLSVLLVHQPISFTNLNCVILLTLSSVLLAIGSDQDGDRRGILGIIKLQYFLGFMATVGAAMLFALYLPLVQLVYKRLSKYKMVMEMQLVMQGAATGLALVAMVAGGGVEEVRKEGKLGRGGGFEYGGGVYWGLVVVVTGVCWQMCFMGTAGLVFLTSSLNCGICMTATLVVNVVGGVVLFGDGFGGVKGVSCVLCVWGFCSYLYGEYTRKKKEEEMEMEMEMVGRVRSESGDGERGGSQQGDGGGLV